MKRLLSLLLLPLVAVQADAAEARRYRLTLKFSQPDFRWSRTITYRDEFHLILDEAPLGVGYWGFVTGVLYPKDGNLHATLSMSKMRGKSEIDAAVLGRVLHARLSADLTVEIPMTSRDFKSCTATFTPLK